MRVISQDRSYSLDFDRTVFWTQYNVIYAKIGIDSVAIGKYESSERTAEVFEDMHKTYSGMPILFQNVEIADDLQQKLTEWNVNCIVAKLPDAHQKVEQIGNAVYYMPKEQRNDRLKIHHNGVYRYFHARDNSSDTYRQENEQSDDGWIHSNTLGVCIKHHLHVVINIGMVYRWYAITVRCTNSP